VDFRYTALGLGRAAPRPRPDRAQPGQNGKSALPVCMLPSEEPVSGLLQTMRPAVTGPAVTCMVGRGCRTPANLAGVQIEQARRA